MKTARRFLAAALASGLLMLTGTSAAFAVDTPPSTALPDLAAVRAKIYAGEFEPAVKELTDLSRTVKHADLYNLLGFSLRSLGRYDEAANWYKQALHYDPGHRPAIEYQGELFIAIGDLKAAEGNVQLLELLCGAQGCAELDKLRSAIAKARAKPEKP